MSNKKYVCHKASFPKGSKSVIELRIDFESKAACIDAMSIDPVDIKLFFAMLRVEINKLRKLKISKIFQWVYMDDWMTTLQNSGKWSKVATDMKSGREQVLIDCDIDDAVKNIGLALGFEEIVFDVDS